MTRDAIWQYAEAIRCEYLRASRGRKKAMLDHFCTVTGHHRKSAIRLLRGGRAATSGRLGRPRLYGSDFVVGLKKAWEATMCVCSKRLAPFLGELVPNLEEKRLLRVSPQVRDQLMKVSPSTIDRLLRPYRLRPRRGVGTTRSAGGLGRFIPVRTFSDKKGLKVGDVEVDLAAHCGSSSADLFINTLVMVDTVTGWTELEAVWGKGVSRVGAAIHRARQRLPCSLTGLNSDNGSEFINHALYRYCKREGIAFTRSRPYKKNDQARVEHVSCRRREKNWSVVRRLVGYDRYDTKAALKALEDLYTLVRLHVNCFQPICKLIASHREGAKVRKQFDRAQTPYQRLMASGALSQEQRQALEAIYKSLNPVQLCAQIEEAQRNLWRLPHPDTRTDKEERILARLDSNALGNPPKTLERYGNTSI